MKKQIYYKAEGGGNPVHTWFYAWQGSHHSENKSYNLFKCPEGHKSVHGSDLSHSPALSSHLLFFASTAFSAGHHHHLFFRPPAQHELKENWGGGGGCPRTCWWEGESSE